MPADERIKKLRWLCRRGMKELDVLLEAFLEKNTEELNSGAWPIFETFLNQEDDQLWHWLQGRETPQSQVFQPLISEIRGDD
jgi:antitoxin CptB